MTGRGLRLAAVLLAVAAFAYGWRVTRIDLGELVTKAHLVRPLVRDLLRPEILERVPRTQEVAVPVALGGAPPPLSPARGPRVEASSRSVRVGQEVELRGEGFAPGRPGRLVWRDATGAPSQLAQFTTDARGSFRLRVRIPDTLGDRGELVAVVVLPETAWRPSETLRLVAERMVETVFLALMGTAMGVVFAVPLSFLGARNLAHGTVGLAVYGTSRTVLNVFRSVEPLILATVFAVWVGIGPFAGVLALGVHSVASLGKLYSEAIEAIDPGPIEAVEATGASRLQVIRYAVIPQIVPQFIAFTIYRWDINVRMSTVIGFVGGGGIGFLLMQYINLLLWQKAATAVWAITLVVALMDYLSARVRERVV
ncbi:MAG: phosphonate ABC transporter, permease protein PhnE [Armatimonadota bacterium]|nr:phosphonate ABC transporter, permease protein PhnE [Armatimonadota bacterium]MDR7387256.1 phosphonate ABC transporter, permease protein PhnE [Armatimonadota bacterium]MDR7389250.1 phosphonate ABC transporter, permease protein PhnE [Armatimonadota bacterium]MDR7393368.1 phosphonate ABC transporter, permease protein PhnE [Armatimonadota bacterium]MDR7396456.1 phosphonate ABC transporter, permease protein PhnE [Armatimonadota bacterium]